MTAPIPYTGQNGPYKKPTSTNFFELMDVRIVAIAHPIKE